MANTPPTNWINIPAAIRTSIADAVEQISHLRDRIAALEARLEDRFLSLETSAQEQSEAAHGASERATSLLRFLQSDVLPQLAQPCSAHAECARERVSQLTRLASVEAIIEAQDQQLQALRLELKAAASREAVARLHSRLEAVGRLAASVEYVDNACMAPLSAHVDRLSVAIDDLRAGLNERPMREEMRSAIGLGCGDALRQHEAELQRLAGECRSSISELARVGRITRGAAVAAVAGGRPLSKGSS